MGRLRSRRRLRARPLGFSAEVGRLEPPLLVAVRSTDAIVVRLLVLSAQPDARARRHGRPADRPARRSHERSLGDDVGRPPSRPPSARPSQRCRSRARPPCRAESLSRPPAEATKSHHLRPPAAPPSDRCTRCDELGQQETHLARGGRAAGLTAGEVPRLRQAAKDAPPGQPRARPSALTAISPAPPSLLFLAPSQPSHDARQALHDVGQSAVFSLLADGRRRQRLTAAPATRRAGHPGPAAADGRHPAAPAPAGRRFAAAEAASHRGDYGACLPVRAATGLP